MLACGRFLLTVFLGERQREEEAAPFAVDTRGIDPDLSAHILDETATIVEAQARSIDMFGSLDTGELLKKLIHVLQWNPRTFVANTDICKSFNPLKYPNMHRDGRPSWCVLEGIVEQIAKNLLSLLRVCKDFNAFLDMQISKGMIKGVDISK